MNKKEEYVIFGTIILIVLACIIYYCFPKKVEVTTYKDDYRIYYHESYLVYDIKVTDVINVDVGEQVQCIKAPCNPIHIKSYKVPYEKKYKDLFDELFIGVDSSTLSISRNDIGYADYVVLSEILNKYDSRSVDYKYEIRELNDSNYGIRGYYIEKLNGETKVIIAMGRKNNGGYSIKIKNVDVRDNNVTITVEETSPGQDDVVTMALTYPSVEIIFPFEVKNVTVHNIDNSKYNLIKK